MFKKVVSVFLCFFFFSTTCFAQAPQQAADGAESAMQFGPKQQMATIIFSGLAGAVLGLSTLSFYSRPQDKLSNIGIGAAIGIIIGTAFTTYAAATKPYGDYDSRYEPKFNFKHKGVAYKDSIKNQLEQPILSYHWSF